MYGQAKRPLSRGLFVVSSDGRNDRRSTHDPASRDAGVGGELRIVRVQPISGASGASSYSVAPSWRRPAAQKIRCRVPASSSSARHGPTGPSSSPGASCNRINLYRTRPLRVTSLPTNSLDRQMACPARRRRAIHATLQSVSAATAAGIILVFVLATSLAVVGAMFWWGAREDGRDQQRRDAQLREKRRRETFDESPPSD